MPETKQKQAGSPSYHRDFVLPSEEERRTALGPFPSAAQTKRSQESAVLETPGRPVANDSRPSLRITTAKAALSDLDDPRLYKPTRGSVTSRPVPHPINDLDWLVQVPEEGQTFEEYVKFLTSRSGRLRPIANVGCDEIVLLPIVRPRVPVTGEDRDEKKENVDREDIAGWPEHGPPLAKLVTLTNSFFDRPVRLLRPAILTESEGRTTGGTASANGEGPKKKKRRTIEPGFFATSARGRFEVRFPLAGGNTSQPMRVTGRKDYKTERAQFQVGPLLDQLAAYREGRIAGGGLTQAEADGEEPLSRSFCVMGITMEDLYDSPSDLFCAGMAFGGSKVAVFSFARYHPHLKMHRGTWNRFGYADRAGSYSYFDADDDVTPEEEAFSVEPIPLDDLKNAAATELCRRSGKLLVHELGHLFGVDHCIHNRCIMNGTGHLVEDFAAPFHLCGVCLRKLQWRLGFDVIGRYRCLADAFASMGLAKEANWVEKQIASMANGSF